MGNRAQMTINLCKIKMLMAFLYLLGAILIAPNQVFAAYDPSKIEAMSTSNFWNAVFGSNIDGKEIEKEYIICGNNSCDPDKQKCIKRTNSEYDLLTKASWAVGGAGGAAAIAAVRGIGVETTIDYQCLDNNKSIPSGWQEAPEGGLVNRIKTRTGGLIFGDIKKEDSCYTGNNDKKYCLVAKPGSEETKSTVTYTNEGTAFQKCEVLPVKLYHNRRCFFCPLFTIVFATANDMTSLSFSIFAKAFAVVIAIGLAIWIAIKTLGQVASLTKQDAPKFLNDLIKQCYKFLIAFLLLQYSSQIYEWGIVPVLNAGINFGSNILGYQHSSVASTSSTASQKANDINPGIIERTQQSNSQKGITYYTGDLYASLDNFVAKIQRELSFMQSVGSSLICVGTNVLMFRSQSLGWGSGFVLTAEGIILAVYAFLLSIAFAFYLLDAIVQLGIAGALMPFLIASWPFKITSKYATTGWNMILNSAFIFIFAGMVILVNKSLVSEAFEAVATTEKQTTETKSDSSLENINAGGLYKTAVAINSQNEDGLKDLADISSIGFLTMILCCYFGFMFMNKTSELAGKFASGAFKPIAPQVATIAGSTIKSGANKFTQHTRDAAENKISQGVHSIASVIAHPIRTARAIKNFFKPSSSNGTPSSANPTPNAHQSGAPAPKATAPTQPVANGTSANRHSAHLPSRQDRKDLARRAQQAGARKSGQSSHANKPKGRSKQNHHRKKKNKHSR
ncbi:MAG: hypothetical protein IKA03_05825 [Alphaproteobacteria bacterium]|nr:hypothetical protein [Alphaproteobacteria bacterium]